MYNVYLKSKNNSKRLIYIYLILFIPFIIYGFYKNGISLYQKDLISFFNLFNIPLFLLFSWLITYVFKKIKKEDFDYYRFLLNIMISMITFPKTNIIIYIILVTLLNILYTFKKCNIASLYMIIYIILSILLKNYSFLNIYEETTLHSYSLINILFGNGSGGICQTFLIYSILSFIGLICIYEYKKQIPITGFIFYYILIILYFIIFKVFNYELLLNNNLIFSFIFINTISIFTPYTKGGNYLYGFTLGLICFILSFFDLNLGVYIISFILSLISPYYDKLVLKLQR